MDEEIFDHIQDATSDILDAVQGVDNNHVEVINHLDKITELLERIAVAVERPAPEALDADELLQLERINPLLAKMYREGRVS